MATTYKFVSLIVCDDCRREDSGKDILIGAYAGSMQSTAIPFLMPTFALRFEIIPNKKEYKQVIAILRNPAGEEVFRVEGTLGTHRTDLPASFFYRVSPVMLTTTGEYKILLGMDEDPEEVATFHVIHAPSGPAQQVS